MLNDSHLAVAVNCALALGIGAMTGIEPERRLHAGKLQGPGLRTFILIALSGAVSAVLGQVLQSAWLVIIPAVLVSLIIAVNSHKHVLRGQSSAGATTQISAVLVYMLGVLCSSGYRELAIMGGIVVLGLQAYKSNLHSLVNRMQAADIYAALKLLFATCVVLPFLPRHAIDPWHALVPYKLWVMVILIAGISFVSYIATRFVRPHHALLGTGLLAGLVSSTATTLALSRQLGALKNASSPQMFATMHHTYLSGILASWAVMFARVLLLIAILQPSLLPRCWPVCVLLSLVCGLCAAYCYWRGRRLTTNAVQIPLRNPFCLGQAIKFAALLGLILLFTKWAAAQPHMALYPLAVVSGLVDVDAAIISFLQQGSFGQALAWQLIILSCLANSVVKFGISVALIRSGVFNPSGLCLLLIVIISAAALLF